MKHRIKKTKKLMRLIRGGWEMQQIITWAYYIILRHIEEKLAEKTGIKDIEFIWMDNEIVGIGNASKTMPLIHQKEIEEVK